MPPDHHYSESDMEKNKTHTDYNYANNLKTFNSPYKRCQFSRIENEMSEVLSIRRALSVAKNNAVV